MEKSPFALSVDNSLLDSIHPLSNSNSGKVSCAAHRVCTYCINKQTRKHTAAYRPAPVIRMCTYTSPRNKPDAEGNGGSCRCVCLENKNASFETCILNSPDSPLLASVAPIHPMCTPIHPVVTALCHWQRTFARLRVVLAYFSSRIRNAACGFFVSFYIWFRNILAIAPTCSWGKRIAAVGMYVQHCRLECTFFIDVCVYAFSSPLFSPSLFF